jgi:hypothetical protein
LWSSPEASDTTPEAVAVPSALVDAAVDDAADEVADNAVDEAADNAVGFKDSEGGGVVWA